MKNIKTKDELRIHKNNSISEFDSYMESLIESSAAKLNGKADKLSYWLYDWKNFLEFETKFDPKSLRRYKRGEIIKVHLGFNVGSEEGGLHYAVVIENDNPKTSPVVTIVPLTSVKPNTDISRLKSGNVFLGTELFTNLHLKITTSNKHVKSEIESMQSLLEQNPNSQTTKLLREKINVLNDEIALLDRMRKEILKMKIGSIALTNQITTISKIRIYDPKTDHDILSGIKLSPEKMDMIDLEIIKKYTKHSE